MAEEKKEEAAVSSNEVPIESLVDRAEKAASRLEEANKKTEELLSRQALSGKAEAGQPQEKPKEETPKEYADRIVKGQV